MICSNVLAESQCRSIVRSRPRLWAQGRGMNDVVDLAVLISGDDSDIGCGPCRADLTAELWSFECQEISRLMGQER